MAGALTAMIAAAFSGGVTSDEYFEYTTLLLPGNGTNGAQNNTFLDGSTNNFTITRNGNTTQGTFSPFSQTGWGNYFDGTGDYLTFNPSTTINIGTSDFTIEAWVYHTGGADDSIYSNSGAFTFVYGATGVLRFYLGGGTNIVDSSTAFISNQWTHVCVSRASGTLRMFQNGTLVATSSSYPSIGNSSSTSYIGRYYGGSSNDWQGYISNLRIVVGTAVYTSAFTPPTSPLTAISGTSLLTCQSNRFIDNSTNNFTITVNGNTSVVAFSPFNPTASWSAATYGGSGYFDGSGDYLSVADNAALDLGNSDFTIEGWVYMPSAPSSSQIVGLVSKWGASGQRSWSVYFYNAGGTYQIYFSYTTDGSTTQNLYNQGFVFPAGQWAHIAVVRSTTTVKFYINGSVAGTGSENISTNTVFDSTSSVAIASDTSTGANYLTGYTSSIRIVKGTAVYTTAFTPPTAPLTAITNTSLLLNFTNAGIYDATSKNDLETVGNAQISTTQSKWGGSSMYFDGTGDWLLSTPSVINDFGTGNFTIEAWIYMTSTSNSFYIYNSSNANFNSPNFTFLYNTSLGLRMYAHAGTYTVNQGSTSGWAANTWYYVALVRNGGTITIYRNGTSLASGSTFSGVSFGSATAFLQICGSSPDGISNNGYIQDLRVSRYARDVTTTPTAAFPTL